MSFATLILAVACVQAGAPEEGGAPAPTPWQRIETLRRLCEQKLSALPDLQQRNPFADAIQRSAPEVDPSGVPSANDAAAGSSLLALLAAQKMQVEGHADCAPGFGAWISIGLDLPVVAVGAESDGRGDGDPAAARDTDDAEWEAASRGGSAGSRNRLDSRGSHDAAAARAVTVLDYSANAGQAVRRTVVDVVGRFAPRLELARDERLAVVVTMRPSHSQLPLRYGFNDALVDPLVRWRATAALDPSGSGAGGQVYDRQGRPLEHARVVAPTGGVRLPQPKRLVVVARGSDLDDLRHDRLSRADFERRLAIQEH